MELYFHHQTHSQLSIISALAQPLLSLWSCCSCPSLFPSLAYWMPSDQRGSSCSVISFLLFLTVYGVLQTRILKMVVISFPSGPYIVSTLHYDPSILGDSVYHGWLLHLIVKTPSSLKGCDPFQYQTVLITIALQYVLKSVMVFCNITFSSFDCLAVLGSNNWEVF